MRNKRTIKLIEINLIAFASLLAFWLLLSVLIWWFGKDTHFIEPKNLANYQIGMTVGGVFFIGFGLLFTNIIASFPE